MNDTSAIETICWQCGRATGRVAVYVDNRPFHPECLPKTPDTLSTEIAELRATIADLRKKLEEAERRAQPKTITLGDGKGGISILPKSSEGSVSLAFEEDSGLGVRPIGTLEINGKASPDRVVIVFKNMLVLGVLQRALNVARARLTGQPIMWHDLTGTNYDQNT